MKRFKDVYGQLLLSLYKRKPGFGVVERDDGYVDVENPKLYFSKYKDWPKHEKDAIKYAKGKILDIGCGAGRHSLYLQKKGFEVFGIDNSPIAIRVCRLRGLKKAKVIGIEDINFKPNSFDTILMLGSNFGLFGDRTKAKKLLRKFHKITSENALIIAETLDPYKTENPAHLKYHKLNKERGRMGGQIRMRLRFRNFATGWFDYLFVSKEEMEKIIKSTGWKIMKFLESDKGRYITILKKSYFFTF